MRGMGIRHDAYEIDPRFLELAELQSAKFFINSPQCDAHCLILAWAMGWQFEESPLNSPIVFDNWLSVDKAWRPFQQVLAPSRPAYALFEGQVTHTESGWIPYFGIVYPDQLQAAVSDLKTLTNEEIDKALPWEQDRQWVRDILESHIPRLEKVCAAGWGLAYRIG
ncbi:hypothetical protein CKALI_08560 [Corynebacterium kalinowskii]|uniref:Uncharacterized protein n=2 Tax=Corynebacterium kalinowskii TaxID=2675216 RepID=A0A6B8VBN8_9CORY|nr:hypothetical protein CKALI_08560 [Corynebacterium kalinowskii]